MRKLKSALPSLKEAVPTLIRSGVVYEIICRGCKATYVGCTCRHLRTRIMEHQNNDGPVKTHLKDCKVELDKDLVKVLASTNRGDNYLLTLEALHIRDRKPKLNTKNEIRGRELIIFG